MRAASRAQSPQMNASPTPSTIGLCRLPILPQKLQRTVARDLRQSHAGFTDHQRICSAAAAIENRRFSLIV